MSMVDIEPSPICKNRIDDRAFRIDQTVAVMTKPTSIPARRLFLIRPLDFDPGTWVAVDDQ